MQTLDGTNITFFPCICGHERTYHVHEWTEDRMTASLLGSCRYDRAFFKGMCICSNYSEMTNLEYLEWKATGKAHV